MDNKDKTNNIKILRDEYGITQKNLGEVVGMSQQAIGKMETGDSGNLKITNLDRLIFTKNGEFTI